jgi:glyoxylase-like metal-dependent hydrolase (beta-lactamase superfamily II)/8-oxo-dGTP pyrophosphatase MutT (NUDIX family)
MTSSTKPPRPASTVIVVRDGSQGPEVFLMQRTLAASFMAGVHVFPGGAVDPADHEADYGVEDARLSALLGIESGGAAYLIAAIRECFEEAGLMLARDAAGRGVALPGKQETDTLRRQLAAGQVQLKTVLAERGWLLRPEDLAYLSHWVTPVGAPKRFDTRFFVAVAPAGQEGSHDDEETIASLWIRPHEALQRAAAGDMKLAHATQSTLRELGGFESATAIMQWAASPRSRPRLVPRVSVNSQGRKVLSPGDFAYAEIGKLDPEGRGTFWSEIRTGEVTQLSPHIWRIAAPNPGFMTGPGTNTYLAGNDKALAVIDPGPDIEEHLARVAEQGAGRIRLILTTHTHRDHSPGAARLQAMTGARVIGMPAPDSEFHDMAFAPDHVPVDGERFEIGGVTLRVVHTPGHASNHCCYLLEEERLLFTGDHIMQGSTVVINPPDGDMAVYLASLAKIRGQGLQWLAPGHGFLMDQPDQRIDRLVAHRLTREAKVLDALQAAGPISASDLVPAVYDDVPVQRHGMALRSLTAHLIKLQKENRAILEDSRWRAA